MRVQRRMRIGTASRLKGALLAASATATLENVPKIHDGYGFFVLRGD